MRHTKLCGCVIEIESIADMKGTRTKTKKIKICNKHKKENKK